MLTVGLDLLQKNFMAKRALVDKICVLNSKLEMTIKDNKIKESLNRRVKQIINRDLILSESSSILRYIKFRAYNDTDQSWEEFLEALASNSNVLQEIHSKGILISSFVHFSCLLQSTCIITTEHLESTFGIEHKQFIVNTLIKHLPLCEIKNKGKMILVNMHQAFLRSESIDEYLDLKPKETTPVKAKSDTGTDIFI